MTPQELEAMLYQVRWQQAEMSPDELAASLRAIGEYPEYLLVLADGKMPFAPDDKNRALVPIFTTPEARDHFLGWLPKDRIQQQIYVSESGFALFRRLAAQSIDGIVFNCLSGQALAFVPSFCQRVLEQQNAEANVDTLMQAAFPQIGDGGFAELDRLFFYLFALPEWFFAVRPEAPQAPAVIFHERRQRVFAFTSSERAVTFVRENGLVDADGEAFFLAIPTRAALSWLENTPNIETLHINFGGHGCFIPIQNLPSIRQRLNVP
jgi:hypothetical protein